MTSPGFPSEQRDDGPTCLKGKYHSRRGEAQTDTRFGFAKAITLDEKTNL
jgi:hypothetical protein